MPTVKRYPAQNNTVNSWTTPGNISADDGVYATTPGARNTNYDLIGFDFGFTIPTGATINSVTIEAQYKLSTTASASTLSMWIQNNGTQRGTAWSSTAEPTTDTIVNTAETGTWTVEELNSTGLEVLFRVRRTSNTACTYSVDYLAVTVDYTEGVDNRNGSFTETAGDQATQTAQKGAIAQFTETAGDQAVKVGSKAGNGAMSQSEGTIDALTSIKSATSSQTDTAGTVESFIGTAVEIDNRNATITDTAGTQETATGNKKSQNQILESSGDQATATGQKTAQISVTESHGTKETNTGQKQALYSFDISHGTVEIITGVKQEAESNDRYATISDTAGFNETLVVKKTGQFYFTDQAGDLEQQTASKESTGAFVETAGTQELFVLYGGDIFILEFLYLSTYNREEPIASFKSGEPDVTRFEKENL